jgi:iron(II)-dependent oxidoreductase
MPSADAPSPRALEFERAAPPLPIEMRPIPAGKATLGSTAGEARAARDECVAESGEANCPVDVFDREAPVTITPVGSFQLAAHEVTNAELFAWLGQRSPVRVTKDDGGVEWIADDRGPLAAIAGPEATASGIALAGGHLAVRPGFGDRPAVWVSHVGAGRFCADAGMRLPSATEWEWAARGPDRRRFPWGNAFFVCRRAVVARDAKLPCSEEGAGPASIVDPMQDRTPEGVDGLGGNVAEWVADAAPSGWQQSGRACGAVGCFVVKGGDWASLPWTARAAAARIAPADFGSGAIGWRCARDRT